jgi:hydrogenase/urease accessory protein HupE
MLRKSKALFFLSILLPGLNAHEFNPAHLVIDEFRENQYEVTWMYPSKNIGSRAEIIFPLECIRNSQPPFLQRKYIVEKISLNCNASLRGQTIEVSNLSILNDALVTITHLDKGVYEGLMNLKEPKLHIPFEEQLYPLSYFSLGIDHLFSGKDHILFIMGLLFLVSGFINVVKTITAFTIAHSITLGLSVFNLISLSQATVEAIIALTIIFLAIEVSERKQYQSTPWVIAFGFGLLHGLGFANALTGIGIGSEQLALSLLFFNLGIEAGQLFMLPFFGVIIWGAYKLNIYKNATICASLILGGMGFYWFIDRTIGIIS